MPANSNNHNNSNGNGHKPNGHKSRRTYSDKQIAEALALLKGCGGNLSRASNEAGVPRKTLERWSKCSSRVNAPEVAEGMAELCQQSATSIADRLEDLIGKILDVAPGKLPEASFGQSMTGLGIATDKMQLLRDKPTSITGNDAQVRDKAVELYLKAYPGATPEQAREQIELASQKIM
jgi:transposase-like protein